MGLPPSRDAGPTDFPFGAPKHWASFEPVLRSSFENDVVTLDVLTDDARPRLAEAAPHSPKPYAAMTISTTMNYDWVDSAIERSRRNTPKRVGVRVGRPPDSRSEPSFPRRPAR